MINVNITGYPGCCCSGILFEMSTNSARKCAISGKKDLIRICEDYEFTALYVQDVNKKHIDIFIKLGFTIIDTIYNKNSGNIVTMLRWIYEEE